MLEKIIYVNHKGEKLDSERDGFYVNYNDLRDYLWDYVEDNRRIRSFKKGIVKKTIPIIIAKESEREAIAIKNRIIEVTEKDIIDNIPGEIIINESYMRGFIIGNSKSNYLISRKTIQESLTFVSDYPFWITEQSVKIKPISDTAVSEEIGIKTYPYSYPYKYPFLQTETSVYVDHYTESDFKLTAYGPTTSVLININGYPYEVLYPLEEGEHMIIDSRPQTPKEEKLYVVRANGEKESIFNYRSVENSIFKKIPAGMVKIDYPRTYGVDLIIYKERSEPPWKSSL